MAGTSGPSPVAEVGGDVAEMCSPRRREWRSLLPAAMARHHGLVTTWMRCYWDEEDVWFYFEVDAEGWVTRQVELQGPEQTPVAAASLDEWQQAHYAGRLDEYDSRFGC